MFSSPRTIQRAAQASLFLPGALCLGLRGVRGLFHFHTPSSAAAAIATAARLVARRISLRTAVLAQGSNFGEVSMAKIFARWSLSTPHN